MAADFAEGVEERAEELAQERVEELAEQAQHAAEEEEWLTSLDGGQDSSEVAAEDDSDDNDVDGEGELFATPIIYGSPSPNMYSRDELYTTRQAKRYLRVTRATLYSDGFRDLLGAFQVGGCENRQIWWPKHRVNAFLDAHKNNA